MKTLALFTIVGTILAYLSGHSPVTFGGLSTLPVNQGGTGTTTAPYSQLIYGGSVYNSVATSSIGAGTGLSFSGTAGAQVGGTAGTYSVNTSQNITTLSNLTSNGYVKTTGGNGTLGVQAVPIPISDGGTGTTTAYSGGILFSDGLTYRQASTTPGFIWNFANQFVGIASSTPFSRLSIGTGIASSSVTVAEYHFGSPNIATSTAAQIDCRTSNQQHWGIGASATTLTLVGLTPGQTCRVIIENAGQTAGALTWAVPSGYQLYWSGGTVPTQTTTGFKQDVWSFIVTQASSTMAVLGAMTANF